MTQSLSKDQTQPVVEISDEEYLSRVNIDLLRSLPFQVQPLDEGRHAVMLGFASIIPKDATEQDGFEAMKRIVIDILKISEAIQKKD